MIPHLPLPIQIADLYRAEILPSQSSPRPAESRVSRSDSHDSLVALHVLTPGRPRVTLDQDSKRSSTTDERPRTPLSDSAKSFRTDYLALRSGARVNNVNWGELVEQLKKAYSLDELLFVKQCDAVLEISDTEEFLGAVDTLAADYLTPVESKAGESSFLCERVNLGHPEKSKLEQCRAACRTETSAERVGALRDAVVNAANNVWAGVGDKLQGHNGQ